MYLRNCHGLICTSCLSIFPITASESLAVPRYGYVFFLVLGKISYATCTVNSVTVPKSHDYHVRGDRVIARAVALGAQLQIALANAEIQLAFPPKGVHSQDFLLVCVHVGAHEAHPVLAVAVVSGVNELCRYGVSLFVGNCDVYGKQVL